MIASLLRRELTHWWEYAIRIARQHDDVFRVTFRHAWYASIRDEVNGIGGTCVFRYGCVVKVGLPFVRVIDNVLQYGSEPYRIVYLRLLSW